MIRIPCRSISLKCFGIEFFGLGLLSIIDTNSVLSPVILTCLSASGLDVSDFVRSFCFLSYIWEIQHPARSLGTIRRVSKNIQRKITINQTLRLAD